MADDKKKADSRIVIVGAGPAGLATAYYLKQNGYRNVTVLEKLGRVGGLCRTITEDYRSFDLGANYVTKAYKETLRLARKVHARTYVEPVIAAVEVPEDKSQPTEFRTILQAVREDRQTQKPRPLMAMLWEAIKFTWWRWRVSSVIDRPTMEGIDQHPELCVTFAEWLESHNIRHLKTLFEIPITMMGFGYIDEIAAPYALRYMTIRTFIPMVIKAFPLLAWLAPWPKRFVLGFQRMWEAVSWQLNVRLNINIESIERDGETLKVEFTHFQQILNNVRTHRDTLEFDFMILACPLDPNVLHFMRLSPAEEGLFEKILTNSYCMTTYHVTGLGLPKPLAAVLPLTRIGTPWAVAQQWSGSNVTQFYSRVLSKEPYGDVQPRVEREVRELVARMNGAIDETKADWHTYDRWPYFQHVTPEDFKAGFYSKLEDLQGTRNTYYVGGATNFELVEPILHYSKNLVRQHFPSVL